MKELMSGMVKQELAVQVKMLIETLIKVIQASYNHFIQDNKP
jgi:hypothetical protein